MKHMSQIKIEKPTAQEANFNAENIINHRCLRLVDYVFARFSMICREYDSLYHDSDREKAEKLIWAKAFEREGILKLGQVDRALVKLNSYKYGKPPMLGVFLDWCAAKPEDLDLPAESAAYKIALRINELYGNYAYPKPEIDSVIRHAIDSIGKQSFRNMKPEDAQKAFKYAYANACRQFADGKLEHIPAAIPEKAQEHPDDKERTEQARKENMAKIWQMLK